MSYDTEHVRNAGEDAVRITGIPTFRELLTNTDLASLYTQVRHSTAATGPDLVETADVSKKTVYEYHTDNPCKTPWKRPGQHSVCQRPSTANWSTTGPIRR